MITTTAIEEMIDAKFALEEARERLYHGAMRPVNRVYESLDLDRFEKVRRALGVTSVNPAQVRDKVVRSFEYGGCVFYCTQTGGEQ